MKGLIILASMLLCLCPARAESYTNTWDNGFVDNGVVPDGNPTGWSDTRTLSGITDRWITNVSITLSIRGGFNGDLFAFLAHDSGMAVLLNRVGKTTTSAAGYDTPGFEITLSSSSIYNQDIHLYQMSTPAASYNGNGQLTGMWLEDGRSASPGLVTDTSNRDALLSSFNGLNPNGAWTLYISDLSGSDTSVLTSWSLTIAAVPEPGTGAILGLGLLAAMWGKSRQDRARRTA